jgi:hypothetical protein
LPFFVSITLFLNLIPNPLARNLGSAWTSKARVVP